MAVSLVGGIVKALGFTLALQGPSSTLDSKVQDAAFPVLASLRDFASHSHQISRHKPVCFGKASSNFVWLPECPDADTARLCADVWQNGAYRGEGEEGLLFTNKEEELTRADCLDLRSAIIRGHVDLALEGHLSLNSAYAPHLAYHCNDAWDCLPIGDLARVSSFSPVVRELLSFKKTTICSFFTLRLTPISKGIYQGLSATIFGEVPSHMKAANTTDVCLTLSLNLADWSDTETWM